MPRFCIIIPCFNNERTIAEALDTALAQQHDDYLVVVGDNGSHDRSPEIIAGYDHPRLLKRPYGETLPKTDNWNRAYREAPDCQYLVTLHGDDRLAPTALDDIATQADRGAPPLIHGRFNLIDADGQYLRTIGLPVDYAANATEFRRVQMYANVVGVAGMTIRTDLFHRLGGWPPEWTYMQDVELWWQLVEYGPARHSRAILGDYRVFDIPINPAVVSEIGRWVRHHMASYPLESAEYRAGRDNLAAYRRLLETKPDFAQSTRGLPLDDLLGPPDGAARGLSDVSVRQRLYRLAIAARTTLSPDRRQGRNAFASAPETT